MSDPHGGPERAYGRHEDPAAEPDQDWQHDGVDGGVDGGAERGEELDERGGSPVDALVTETVPPGGRRKAKRRGARSCLVLLVSFVAVMALLYVGLTRGITAIQDQFSEAADYPGPGTGQIAFEVASGDTAAAIGRNLRDQDVVASVDAFVAAANADPDSAGIQAGTYQLQTQMRAADALAVLVDPAQVNAGNITVAVPEGLRVVDIVGILSESTGLGANRFNRALRDPVALGLPDYAEGNPEGYLFPATYSFAPDTEPAAMLTAMVDRWRQAAEAADLEGAAARLGYTPGELMTVASLVEAEGRGDDMYRISRAIYNRLDNPDNGVTNGFLQVDASVNYGLDQDLGVGLTSEQLQEDTRYNTYTRTGLPPTPIEAPGDLAIDAAANPVDGPWLFWVTVDLETGETKFTDSYEEFLGFDEELCDNAPETC